MSNGYLTDSHISKGMKGAGGIAAGVTLLVLNGMTFPFALIAGAVLIGAGAFMVRKPREDGKYNWAGVISLSAGILTAVSTIPFVGGLAGILLFVSGIGLLGGGIYSLYQLIKGKATS